MSVSKQQSSLRPDVVRAPLGTDSRINRLREVDDVRTVLAYETAHEARKGVLVAARERLEELTAEFAAES